jgi:signal peptidase II
MEESPLTKAGIGEHGVAPILPIRGQTPAAKRRRYLFFSLGLAAIIAIVDQVTKLWIRSHIMPWQSVPAEGVFRLTRVQNTGAAFGLFTSQTATLIVVSLVAVLGLVLALRYQPLRSVWTNVALGLLLGGSVGNMIDRLRLGYVTDFIDIGFKHGWRFYIFNVADSAITVGSILLVFSLIGMGKDGSTAAPISRET